MIYYIYINFANERKKMSKKYIIDETVEPKTLSEPTSGYLYSHPKTVTQNSGNNNCDLTANQLQRILKASDAAIAKGEVYTHEEVMKRLNHYF